MGVIVPPTKVGATEVTNKVAIPVDNFTASLANGAEIDTGFLDLSAVDNYYVTFKADSVGLDLVQESRDNDLQPVLTSTTSYTASPLFQADFPARQKQVRLRLQNNSGSAITNVSFVIRTYSGSTNKPPVFPIDIAPRAFSSGLLTQSVIIGKDFNGDFRNTAVNTGGAILTADFGTDVALGKIPNYKINTKFGRNNDIDTGTAPADIWNGGGEYTGFNCTAAETLEVFSDNIADSGTLIATNAATGGSGNIIQDDDAAFISDGVSVGDIVINDTQQFHGIVSSVDSETQLTVYAWYNGDVLNNYSFSVGDVYRIATAASTGAAVIRLNGALDGDYNPISEYVILNGTTPVTTTKSFIRQARGTIELSGSGNINAGEITARQSTTTANVTMVMPANSGQTAIACATVPAGKVWVVKDVIATMVIDGNQSGSAQLQFQVRSRGGSWQTKRFVGLSNSNGFNEAIKGGITVDEQSDVRWRCQSVSTNNTQVTALFEYFEINKETA